MTTEQLRQEQGFRLSFADKRWFEMKAKQIWFSPMNPSCKAPLAWSGLALKSGHSRDRVLTTEEYTEIIRLIRAHVLPCTMLQGDISYRLAVAVYDHPATLGGAPLPIFAFSDMHLPNASDKLTQDVIPTWNTLCEDIVLRPENLSMLRRYKLPLPTILRHYCV